MQFLNYTMWFFGVVSILFLVLITIQTFRLFSATKDKFPYYSDESICQMAMQSLPYGRIILAVFLCIFCFTYIIFF